MLVAFISAFQIASFVYLNLLVPGLLLLSFSSLSPTVVLLGAVPVSSALLFITAASSFLIFHETRWIEIYSWINIFLAVYNFRKIAKLFSDPNSQTLIKSYFYLLAWCFFLTGFITIYSGGDWYGDWLEHYLRAKGLQHGFGEHGFGPTLTPEQRYFHFAERPPLANLLIGLAMGMANDGFLAFQMTSLFLGLLIVLPAVTIAYQFSGLAMTERWPKPIFLAFFAFQPALVQHLVYPWTRALTAYFVLTAIALWEAAVAAERDHGNRPMNCSYFLLGKSLALLSLSLACLTHYSALVWAIPCLPIYILCRARQRSGKKRSGNMQFNPTFLIGLLASAALLMLWLVLIKQVNASADFFEKNVFARSADKLTLLEHITHSLQVLRVTVLPSLLESFPWRTLDPTFSLASLRNRTFYFYQCSIPGIISLTGLASIIALYVAKRKGISKTWPTSKLTLTVLGAIFLAPSVYPLAKPIAYAHTSLLPLAAISAALAAKAFALGGRRTRYLLTTLLVMDLTLGVCLQSYGQHRVLGERLELYNTEVADFRPQPNVYDIENKRIARNYQVTLLGESIYPYTWPWLAATAGLGLWLFRALVVVTFTGGLSNRRRAQPSENSKHQ